MIDPQSYMDGKRQWGLMMMFVLWHSRVRKSQKPKFSGVDSCPINSNSRDTEYRRCSGQTLEVSINL